MPLDIDALESELQQQQNKGIDEAEKQVRITLAADAPSPWNLSWHTGRIGGLSRYSLVPGKSMTVAMHRAQAWCGPFIVVGELQNNPEPERREALIRFFRDEKRRILDQYDYPRGNGKGYKPDMQPSGPHRFPHVIVEVIDADGTVNEPIDLHQLYKIGEYDPIKDQLVAREAPEALEAAHLTELTHARNEISELRRAAAEASGIVKGLALASSSKG